MNHKLYAVCAPGLDEFVSQELQMLGCLHSVAGPKVESGKRRKPFQRLPDITPTRSIVDDVGGVIFEGDLEAIYRVNLHLRTASRVLLRLGDFGATSFADLRKHAGQLNWESYIHPGQAVVVRATCHKSRLYHSDAVAERVSAAIGDRLGQPAPTGKFDERGESPPPQMVIVRLVHDRCFISVDTSGALLHRRGYRLAVAKAPLRETLAAAIVLASGWDHASPLLDPFCGSGTIPIEAALIAHSLAPGRNRRFAFMDWPVFDEKLWNSVLEAAGQAAAQAVVSPGRPFLQASDRDTGAVEMALANAERAGVSGLIEFSRRAVSAIQPPVEAGWVVTNPPYGLRVSANKDLRNLYAQFGNVLRQKCSSWHVAVLCSDLTLLGHTGLKLDSSMRLVNGGAPVRLGRGVVP